jgi:fatty acid desaturase
MSYNSKRTITSLIAGLILTAAYAVYALGGSSPAPGDLKLWAIAMLVFIGIAVVAMIVVHILFHIAVAIGIAVKERQHDDKTVERIIAAEMSEDERDKIINLKAYRIGYICAGVGFVAALVALAFGLSAVFALHILFGASAVGSFAEGIASVYFYEKGVRNG